MHRRTNFILIWLMLLLSVHALGQEPKSAEQFNNRGLHRMAFWQKADALRDFDQAFKLNPDLKPQYKEFIEGQRRP